MQAQHLGATYSVLLQKRGEPAVVEHGATDHEQVRNTDLVSVYVEIQWPGLKRIDVSERSPNRHRCADLACEAVHERESGHRCARKSASNCRYGCADVGWGVGEHVVDHSWRVRSDRPGGFVYEGVGAEDQRQKALERLEWIADTYLSVGTPVQCAASGLLEAGESVQQQIRDRTRENLGFVREVFQATPATVLDVEGGWSAILRVPSVRSEEEWVLQLLTNHNLLVQPGFFYDFASEAFLVVSLLPALETFRQGISCIRLFLECA